MTGGKLEDAPIRAAVLGATPKSFVAPVKVKAKAEAGAKAKARAKERAKEKVRVKVRKAAKRAAKRVVKREVKREDDHGLVRQAAEHPLRRGMARLRAEDRLLRIQRKCACYTPKGHARRVTKTAHSYTIQRVCFIKQVDAEMGPNACSRTEIRKVYLPLNRSARS